MKNSLIKFNPKNSYSTYLKNVVGSNFLYLGFSKSGFGFGEISVHQSQTGGDFSCMNEMMSLETCTDIVTSFVLSLPVDETVKVVKHDGLDFLHLLNEKIAADYQEVVQSFTKNKPASLAPILMYVPCLDISDVEFNVDEGTASAIVRVDDGSQSFFKVVFNYDLVDKVKFYSPFYNKLFEVTPEDITNYWVSDEYHYHWFEINTFLTAFLHGTDLHNENKNLLKSIEYFEVQGKPLEGKIVSALSSDVNSLKVEAVKKEGNFFTVEVEKDGVSYEVGVKHIPGFENKDLYSIYSTGGNDLIYDTFAKILSNMILEDQDHMDYRDLCNEFDCVATFNMYEKMINDVVDAEKSSDETKNEIESLLDKLRDKLILEGFEVEKVNRLHQSMNKRYSNFYVGVN